MNTKLVVAAVIGTSLVVGCGGSSGVSVAAYRQLASEVSTAVQQHDAASATLTPATCPTEMNRYGAQVRPMLDRMAGMSADMDHCWDDAGHADSADMQSTCHDMTTELDRHLGVACSGDIAAEAAHHASEMGGMLQHEQDRAASMQGMMGGGSGMMSGGMCHS